MTPFLASLALAGVPFASPAPSWGGVQGGAVLISTSLNLIQAPSFEQIETQKTEAINKLTGFRGTYVMVSIPQEGTGTRQEVGLVISPDGRRTKLNVNGQDVAESAYNKKQKWTAYLTEKVYELTAPEEGYPLPPITPPLRPAEGQMSLTIDDLGVRFATNPAPVVAPAVPETLNGKKVTRYDAKALNPGSDSQVQITQWFDTGTYILRQFEITKTTKGRTSRILGYLVNDQINSAVPISEFDFPSKYANTFRKITP